MADEYRISQFGFEVLENPNSAALVTAFAVEALHDGDPNIYVTSVAIEALVATYTITRRQPLIGFSNKNEEP